MKLAPPPRRQSDDGIVPLINIVFLLLIFFLIVGTIAPKHDISVAFPETQHSPVARAPSQSLYVSSAGFISYRGVAVGLDALPAAVRAGRNPAAPDAMPVVVDRNLPATELAPVLGALAGAGIKSVRLITVRRRPAAGGRS